MSWTVFEAEDSLWIAYMHNVCKWFLWVCTYSTSESNGFTFFNKELLNLSLKSPLMTLLPCHLLWQAPLTWMISVWWCHITCFLSFPPYDQTGSRVLFLPNGGNPETSWPNSIPKDGSKIDTDPHTFGCTEPESLKQSHTYVLPLSGWCKDI